MNIAIYLAGSIKKDHEKSDDFFWTEEDMSLLRKGLKGHSVSFLNPAFRTDDLSDSHSVFGRDMLQVFSSHFVFVDARGRRGLGVGAEMMWAKVNRIPVVTWAPQNSHYRKDLCILLDVPVENYVHPFVESLSDQIVEDLEEGAQWILGALHHPDELKIKGLEAISAAMHHYQTSQFHKDKPMQEIMALDELSQRMHRNHPQVTHA